MKLLNLGCGMDKIKGAVNLDVSPHVHPDVIWDLNIFPYPFEDEEFDIVLAKQILEHLDDLVKVMNELWRILKPRGILRIWTPHFAHRDSYTDPTHKHFFALHTFDYWDDSTTLGKRLSHERGVRTNFKILKTKLHFDKQLQPIVFLIRPNKFRRVYEGFFANIFPACEIYYKLRRL